jgi:hypothetical protein
VSDRAGAEPRGEDVLITVTRLRLASPRFLFGFLWLTCRSGWQARQAAGFRGMRLLADRRLTFWTATAWSDAASMKAFRGTGSHRVAMRHLADWCDEASVARWVGPADSVRDWPVSCARMAAEGEASHVKRPSVEQRARAWAAPRLRPLVEVGVSQRQG